MENYETLINELLQEGTPRERYKFLVNLLNKLAILEAEKTGLTNYAKPPERFA